MALGNALGIELNVYAAPALLTLILLVAETVFLLVALPETRGKAAIPEKPKSNGVNSHTNGKAVPKSTSRGNTVEKRIKLLKSLQRLHFLFLGVFSGAEFTLTFLTFDRA